MSSFSPSTFGVIGLGRMAQALLFPLMASGQVARERVQAVVAAIEPHDSAERYRSLGVEVLQGRARLLNPWTVKLQTRSEEHTSELQSP